MKKTTLVKLLALLMLLFVSVGSTLAYLTDVEQEVNVMTLGRVEIDLIEQERNAAGNLTDFQDNHPLYPGYYPKGLEAFDKDGYWLNVQNAVDKVVTVKNTGKVPAYVRLWFAFEVTDNSKFFPQKIHLNKSEEDWQWEHVLNENGNYDFLVMDDSGYYIMTATYSKVLAPGATTPVSLRQVLLDSSATNDDYIKLGDKYSIFVVAQGMQTVGFDNAHHALNEGFGEIAFENHPFAGMTEENVGDGNDSEFTIYPAEKIDWFTGGIQQLLPKGAVFDIYDVKTKIVWKAKRGAGDNHAEIEPLTQADTAQLCAIYGVDNAQDIRDDERRPCLITIDNRTFACSLYGVPKNSVADTIVDNNLEGTLCLFFTNSTGHGTGVMESHEAAIEYAYQNAPNGHKKDDIPADALVISTPEELCAFSSAVNSGYSFANQTVVLDSDIDMTGYAWDPINIWGGTPIRVFDGQGHTISHIPCSLFGYVLGNFDLTIRNFTIVESTIMNTCEVGAIVQDSECTYIEIDNCHVFDSTIIGKSEEDWVNVGTLAGNMYSGCIKNCSVHNCSVYTEDIAGQLVGNAFATEITGCTVENINLYRLQKDEVTSYIPVASKCGTMAGTLHDTLILDMTDMYRHNWLCSRCGARTQSETCVVDCQSSLTCIHGKELSKEYLSVRHQWENINITDSTHTIACAACGEVYKAEEHHAYCLEAKDGICAGCGANGVTIGNQWHYEGYKNITATTHDYGCLVCDYVESTNDHVYYYNSTHCELCGAEKVIKYVKLIQNGVYLRKTPSGSVISKLDIDTVWPIISTQDSNGITWFYIDVNGTYGYVHGNFVTPCDSKGNALTT